MGEKRSRFEDIRLRRENTTVVATAMIAADKKANAEKTARLRAARAAAHIASTSEPRQADAGRG